MKHKHTGNLTDVLSSQAESIPDAIAIRMPNSSLTYKQLDSLVWNTTTFLQQHEMCSGDVVSLTFKSELLQVITMLAVARMGGTVFSLPVNTPPLERKELLQKTKTKISLTDIEEENTSTIYLDLNILKKLSSPIDKSTYAEAPLSPWIIVSGSGSTGKSKLIPVTHQQQIERMKLSFHSFPLTEKECFTSLVHTDQYSSKFLILAALQSGISIALFDREHATILKLYDSLHITVIYMTVFHLQQLVTKLPAQTKNRMKNLKALLVAGSSVSDPLRHKVSVMLSKQLYIGYGTNETGSTVRSGPPASYSTTGTVGYPLPGLTVEVVDKAGNSLSSEQTGQIRIKGSAVIDGYIDDDEATQRAFKDGWFYPGDLGKFTKDGELIHLGRTDDMMITNGINIYPAEIEQVISRHPEVEDAVAMPVRSDVHQQVPVCAVKLSDHSRLTEQILLDYTSDYLGMRSPNRVLIVDAIPRNEQGKLIRKEMIDIMNHQLSDVTQNHIQKEEIISRKYVQFTQPYTIQVQKNLPENLEHIDTWLTDILCIDIEPYRSNMSIYPSQMEKHRIELVWRIMLLSKTLLQSVRIPVFYTGEILKIDDNHSEYDTIKLLLAHIDKIPKNVYIHAFRLSLHLISHFMQRPMTEENVQKLFQMMQKRFIMPQSHVSGSGKSTMPILQEAYRKKIPFLHIKNGTYQLGWGSKSKRISRSSTELDSPIGSMMSHNKIITALVLQDAGLPSGEHKVAKSQDEAILAAKDLGWPLVVKPSDADRGEGVTIDVVDENILTNAFSTARDVSKSKTVLIEKQVHGVCCRIFIANEKMLYAVKRLPKSVIGNGENSVKELIEQANTLEKRLPPWKKSEIFPFDDEAIEAITLAGFTLDAIPKLDELVPLRKIESTQWGGVDEDITKVIHPDNLDLALRAAKLFGLNVAGIDIITSDISVPWYLNGAIVNEVNYSPQYGGGEISRNTIGIYLDDLVQDDGRLPITVIMGDSQAIEHAKKIQKEYLNNGIRAFITNHERSLTSAGEEIHMTSKGLFKRTRALLMDQRTEALILLIQTDELLQTGLPVDSINHFIIDSKNLHKYNAYEEPLSKNDIDKVIDLLQTFTA